MRSSKPLISIGICSHSRVDQLQLALVNLLIQSADDIEFIVVDDGSTDGTPEMLANIKDQHPNARIISQRLSGEGLSVARSSVCQLASGEFIVFFDDDIVPNPNYIKNLRQVINQHGADFDICGGPAFATYMGYSDYPLKPNQKEKLSLISNLDKPYVVGQVPVGANMVVRATVFEDFSFDPNLGRKGTSLTSNEEVHLFAQVEANRIWLFDCLSVMHCVDAERLTESWMQKRYFAQGQSGMRLLNDAGSSRRYQYLLKLVVAYIASLLFQPTLKGLRAQQIRGALNEV